MVVEISYLCCLLGINGLEYQRFCKSSRWQGNDIKPCSRIMDLGLEYHEVLHSEWMREYADPHTPTIHFAGFDVVTLPPTALAKIVSISRP